jgi:hypothetical protein
LPCSRIIAQIKPPAFIKIGYSPLREGSAGAYQQRNCQQKPQHIFSHKYIL